MTVQTDAAIAVARHCVANSKMHLECVVRRISVQAYFQAGPVIRRRRATLFQGEVTMESKMLFPSLIAAMARVAEHHKETVVVQVSNPIQLRKMVESKKRPAVLGRLSVKICRSCRR